MDDFNVTILQTSIEEPSTLETPCHEKMDSKAWFISNKCWTCLINLLFLNQLLTLVEYYHNSFFDNVIMIIKENNIRKISSSPLKFK